MKLLAIDGNSIINRAFYGIKLLTTKDGKYTNAVYGFINILNRLKEAEQPDGIAVAFDLKKPTFRHLKYAEYKAGRHATPPELLEQFAPLKEWLSAMGYSVIECEGFEADDILGTLAKACEDSGNECVVATGDKDSLQLISDKVRVVLSATRMGGPEITNYDKAALFEKYGLTPSQMIELKALMGDSSDNIPGVAGIGEKTATDLISRFGDIDYIYEHLDELDIKAGVRTKLEVGKESAFFSRWLGTISREAPIDINPESYLTKAMDNAKVASIMTELEFFKLMEKMGISPVAVKKTEKIVCEKVTFVSAEELLKNLGKRVDLVRVGESFGAYSNCLCAEISEAQALELLASDTEKSLYDAKWFYKFAVKNGIEPKSFVFDTMLAAYVCNPSSSSYELDRLLAEYGAEVSADIENEAAKAAAANYAVAAALRKELEKTEQDRLYFDIELPLATVLGDMELRGVLIDANALKIHGEELGRRILELEKEIYELIGYEFNLNSPKQLGVALFEHLGLPAKKKTKSGYSTNADVLEDLRTYHPAIDEILEYRKLTKLNSTYVEGLLNALAPDGRVHTRFNQKETRTGRISSLEPNLQNIPIRTELGAKMRGFFTAKEGYTLVDADYSQIELRVLAHLAKDENMISAFTGGTDIHTQTASQVFGVPEDYVTSQMRSSAKAVNFGIVYGIGAWSLGENIGVSTKEAQQYIESYLNHYSGVDRFMKESIETAKKCGFAVTSYGRRRYLPELSSSNFNLRAFGERVARNMPIQGTAADIIKLAMVKVENRLLAEKLDAKLIMQVHDELIVEANEACAEKVAEILKYEMENAAKLSVPMEVDVGIGKTWLLAH